MAKPAFPYKYYSFLDTLPEADRKIVVDYYGLGARDPLTIEEIAELERKPWVSTLEVRTRLSASMSKLREAHDRAEVAKHSSSSR